MRKQASASELKNTELQISMIEKRNEKLSLLDVLKKNEENLKQKEEIIENLHSENQKANKKIEKLLNMLNLKFNCNLSH